MSKVPHFPETGFSRINSIIKPHGPIPVSKSTWWEGVRSGRYPKPVKFGPKISAWCNQDLRKMIENASNN